jgi:hypothetical protein
LRQKKSQGWGTDLVRMCRKSARKTELRKNGVEKVSEAIYC